MALVTNQIQESLKWVRMEGFDDLVMSLMVGKRQQYKAYAIAELKFQNVFKCRRYSSWNSYRNSKEKRRKSEKMTIGDIITTKKLEKKFKNAEWKQNYHENNINYCKIGLQIFKDLNNETWECISISGIISESFNTIHIKPGGVVGKS